MVCWRQSLRSRSIENRRVSLLPFPIATSRSESGSSISDPIEAARGGCAVSWEQVAGDEELSVFALSVSERREVGDALRSHDSLLIRRSRESADRYCVVSNCRGLDPYPVLMLFSNEDSTSEYDRRAGFVSLQFSKFRSFEDLAPVRNAARCW